MEILFDKQKIIFIKIFLFISVIFLISQGCRCLICENQGKDNPQYNLGQLINSTYDDFAPILLDNKTIIFSSNRGGMYGFIVDTKFYGEDLFLSKVYDGAWTKPTILEFPTSTGYNEGTISLVNLNNNLSTIIARTHSPQGIGGSDLYLTNFNGINFDEFKNLGSEINTQYWESHPSISGDGNILIFSSNRPGGLGGADLYVSFKMGNSWSIPQNLGPNINTEFDEISPFLSLYDNETILFYSSNYLGKDFNILYAFQKNDFNWYNSIELDNKINSSFNEMFPAITDDFKYIYFSSDRPGGCGALDLYSAPLFIEKPCPEFEGIILDEETKKPLIVKTKIKISSVYDNFEIINSESIIPRSEFIVKNLCSGDYIITMSAKGYLTKDIDFNIGLKRDKRIFTLKSVSSNPPKKIFDLKEYNIPFFVTGYYKLNTTENLEILRKRLKTDLATARYIENPGNKYDKYAEKIESIFRDSVYTFVIDTLLPEIRIDDEYIEIEVFGYTDPRRLNSIYVEESIEYNDMAVYNNTIINNEILSNLRAYYTMIYLDQLLMKNEEFRELKNIERIKYRIQGLGVDTEKKDANEEIDYDARRRVQIKIWQKPLNDN